MGPKIDVGLYARDFPPLPDALLRQAPGEDACPRQVVVLDLDDVAVVGARQVTDIGSHAPLDEEC